MHSVPVAIVLDSRALMQCTEPHEAQQDGQQVHAQDPQPAPSSGQSAPEESCEPGWLPHQLLAQPQGRTQPQRQGTPRRSLEHPQITHELIEDKGHDVCVAKPTNNLSLGTSSALIMRNRLNQGLVTPGKKPQATPKIKNRRVSMNIGGSAALTPNGIGPRGQSSPKIAATPWPLMV